MSYYIGFERRFEFDWLREPGFWEVHFGWLYFGAVDVRPDDELKHFTWEEYISELDAKYPKE